MAGAQITRRIGSERYLIGQQLNADTYGMMQAVERSHEEEFRGRISSYNINTYRGRVYVGEEQRPIPFELASDARDTDTVSSIARSLSRNAATRDPESDIDFRAIKIISKTGRVKTLIITEVS